MALLTSPIYTHKNPKVNITSTITGINHMKTAGRAIINQPPNNIF